MTRLPEAIRTVRWMVRDTFRQSLHTKLFWVMLGATLLCTAFCASIRVQGGPKASAGDPLYSLPKSEAAKIGTDVVKQDGVAIKDGEISFGFGAVKSPIGKTKEDSVKFAQIWIAALVGDSLGILLALIWTAGFLPSFLEPHSATVLFAKPAPRWGILLGKYLGVVGFVALQATIFIASTWLAMGIATGVWNGAYWFALPLLVVNFAIFYAVSTFIAVCSRSTVAAAFGTLLFWILSWAMNYTHHRLIAFPVDGLGGTGSFFLELGYWFLPKPLDMGGLFFQAMGAEGFYSETDELTILRSRGQFYPAASVGASAAFAVTTLAFACYELETTDY